MVFLRNIKFWVKCQSKYSIDQLLQSKAICFLLLKFIISEQNIMIDQASLINQSHLVQEFSKPQPQLTEHELQNIQTVQKTIKKYQNKVAQMLNVIQKQKKHNDSLKQQLKTLNDTLNTMIEKINTKNQKKQDQHPKQDVVKKSLENQIKKSVALKKEVDSLRAKVKVFQGQKITDLHDQIRQKGKVIQQLTSTIKMYQKIEKQEMNLDIYKKYQEANDKINSLNGELLHIKKKLNQTKKHQQIQQKSIKQQHQKMISLQTKVKASSTTANFQKTQEKNEAASSEAKKLKQNFQALQNAKKTNQKALRSQIQNLKLKNRVLQKQLDEAKSSLSRKDKQANILVSKMKQISRKSHQTLEPVQKVAIKPLQIQNSSGLFDQRKQFKGLMFLQGTSRKFDDSEQLPLQKSYKMKSLKFSYFQQHIVQLISQYQLPDGSIKSIQSFKIAHSYQNLKIAELILNQFEYIKDMEIYCSKFIQFMRIRTSRDQVLEVGNQKNHLKCKKFNFDIKTNQKPIVIMGAIESKKLGNENSKQLLISIGLQIKKKQVFTKSRFHPALRAQSIKKHGSVSGFRSNDKNKLQIQKE